MHSRPVLRLSSSAPTYPSTLSDPMHLPLPSARFGGASAPASAPPAPAHPHPLPLQRNASAPVLGGDAHPHSWHVSSSAAHARPHALMPAHEPPPHPYSAPASRPPTSAVPIPPRLPSRFVPIPTLHASHMPSSAPPSYPASPSYAASPPCASSPPLRGSGSLKSTARKSTGRRDSYTRFTAEEEAMLLEGVRLFGVGNWKKILNTYQFHWKRTAVDLKDKYRNITRAKIRRMNASSQSDLSSLTSDGDSAFSPPTVSTQSNLCSPLQGPSMTPTTFSPVSTAGSLEARSFDATMSQFPPALRRPHAMSNSQLDKERRLP